MVVEVGGTPGGLVAGEQPVGGAHLAPTEVLLPRSLAGVPALRAQPGASGPLSDQPRISRTVTRLSPATTWRVLTPCGGTAAGPPATPPRPAAAAGAGRRKPRGGPGAR